MKDYVILGFILGSPYVGKLPCGPVEKGGVNGAMLPKNPNDCHSSGPPQSLKAPHLRNLQSRSERCAAG